MLDLCADAAAESDTCHCAHRYALLGNDEVVTASNGKRQMRKDNKSRCVMSCLHKISMQLQKAPTLSTSCWCLSDRLILSCGAHHPAHDFLHLVGRAPAEFNLSLMGIALAPGDICRPEQILIRIYMIAPVQVNF